MKVLLTGAFGNVGSSAIEALLAKGHEVTCFDLKNRVNQRLAKKYQGKVRVVWGDLRRFEDLLAAVRGQEVVIHLAFIIPKLSHTGVECEREPAWAREINVGGTANLLRAMKAQPAPPKILFSSSLHVYGKTQHLHSLRQVGDPVQLTEHYIRHKVACEEMIRNAGLEWSIFRLAAVLPISIRLDPGMFDVPLENRIEFVHTRDVGLALANALDTPEVWGRVLQIGGGPRCQFTSGEMMRQILEEMKIGILPAEAFTKEPFPTDWLDTRDSDALLHYQTRTLNDYVREVSARLGWRRLAMQIFRPLVRTWILSHSQPYRLAHNPAWQALQGRTALVTGASSGIGAATARLLASRGLRVILVARREDRLQALAQEITDRGGEAIAFVCDLAREEECSRLYQETNSRFGPIDFLVNSAGLGWYGFLAEMPLSTARQMVAVNNGAVVQLSLLFLQEMQRRGRGLIVQIGSIAGSLPEQGIALYSASKSFLDYFSRALYRELRGGPVRISLVKPGPVATEFYQTSPDRVTSQDGLRIPGERWSVRPEVVAQVVWSQFLRPRRVTYIPAYLCLTPALELFFGWAIDLLGPALLRTQLRKARISRA